MKLIPEDKLAGLETPDGQFRARPDKDGAITWPDEGPAAQYATDAARKTGFFRVHGRLYGGYGPGRLPKPYRTADG